MRRGFAVVVSAVVAVLVVAGALSGPAADAGPRRQVRVFEAEEPMDCDEFIPAGVAVPGAVAVDYDVAVLLDGVSESAARQIMAEAAEVYAPQAIRLEAVSYAPVTFASRDGGQLINLSRSHFGGSRPAGSDAVLLLTDKDITDSGGIVGDALAGLADCIGGIKYAQTGFVVAEADGSAVDAARTTAHELGHTTGAHHHYANCVEAVAAVELFRPCTVMINDIGLAALTFSTLNAAMISFHLRNYGGH